MTEKRQTSQGYIIRILQRFAMKLRNITNFVMLFQAVMKFVSRLVSIKISLKRGKVIGPHWMPAETCCNVSFFYNKNAFAENQLMRKR
jgi:hypothetical protein